MIYKITQNDNNGNPWGPIFQLVSPSLLVDQPGEGAATLYVSCDSTQTQIELNPNLYNFSTPPFIVRINNEYMKVTSLTTNQNPNIMTVERGIFNSVVGPHDAGAYVYQRADWKFINQIDGLNNTTSDGGMYLYCTSGNNNVHNLMGLIDQNNIQIPTPYNVEVGFLPLPSFIEYSFVGAFLYETATGKALFFAVGQSTNNFYAFRYSSVTSWASTPYAIPSSMTTQGTLLFRIVNSGTTLAFEISNDLINWYQLYSESTTAFFTTGPDCFGVAVDNYSQPCGMNLIHWNVVS